MNAHKIVSALLVATILTAGCGPDSRQYAPANDSTAVNLTIPADPLADNEGEATYNEYETRYAVIVAQTDDYHLLQDKMYAIAGVTDIPVDTMDRIYDEQTHRLRERDTTEMDVVYLPWRGEGRNLSIEYGDFYDTTIASGQMILLGGLYTTPESADTVLKMILPLAPNAVIKPCRIFMGCML